MVNYFRQPIELYSYINIIPGIDIFGLPDHFYFYSIIILILAVILILLGLALLKNRSWSQVKKGRIFIYFILLIWLLTLARWFNIQGQWLKNDFNDFYGRSPIERRQQAISRLIQSYGLSDDWHDFYDFLEFGRQEIPAQSRIYVLPVDPSFLVWAQYWLYPDLRLVDDSAKADYLLSFNVNLPESVQGFTKFKQLTPNKLILIRSDLLPDRSDQSGGN